MNIIKFDYDKLYKNIDEYIFNNNDIVACPYTHISFDRPIVLMNSETLNFIEKNIATTVTIKKEKVPMINGCYIAIAEWLPFGEVELK